MLIAYCIVSTAALLFLATKVIHLSTVARSAELTAAKALDKATGVSNALAYHEEQHPPLSLGEPKKQYNIGARVPPPRTNVSRLSVPKPPKS